MTATFQYKVVHAKRTTCETSRVRGLKSKTASGQNVQSVSVIAPLPLNSFIESPVSASRLSTLDALRTIFQNAVPHSSIQRTSPAPTPGANRCHSIRDNEIPS